MAGGSLSGTTINGAKVTVGGSSNLTLSNAGFLGGTSGTLTNSAQLETLGYSFGNAVGGTVTNTVTGLIQIDDYSALTLNAGTYTNAGTITMNASGDKTELIIGASNITLGGGGSIVMSNNSDNLIYGLSKADTLTNQETISGAGNIGDGQMTLVNSGTINANQSTALTIDANGGFTNTGTLSVANGSTLQITTDTLFQNFSGTTLTGGNYNVAGILQFGSSGTSLVTNAANITLNGTTAQIQDTAGNNLLKLFASNASGASFALAGGANFTTAGNFTNNGSLTVGSGSKFSVNGSLTNLSGTTLTGGSYNLAGTLQFGASGTSLVTNASNITLNGASSQIIDAASNNILKNFANNASTGFFTLAGGRSLTTAGNFTNSGSLNIGSGSKFSVNGNLTNFSNGTLTGGTYLNAGTLQFNGANIITNAANLTMTGTASKITDQTGTANALASFAANAAAGLFTLSGNQSLTVAGNFSNAGALTVASGSTFGLNNGGTYTQTAGSTIVDGTLKSSATTAALNLNAGSVFGTGTLGFSVVNSGTLTPGNSAASTSLLDVSGTYKQNSGGILNISIAGTTAGTKYDQLKVTGAATVGGTLNLSLLNGYVPAVGTVFDILSGSSVSGSFATVNGAINNSEHFTVTCTAGNCNATVVSGAAKASLTPTGLTSALVLASPVSSHLVSGVTMTGGYTSSTTRVPAAASAPVFPANPLAMMPSKLARIASSPFNAGNGRGYKGMEFGVDMISLFKTNRKTMLKAFTGSEYVAPIGYLASMTY